MKNKSCLDGYLTNKCRECPDWSDGTDGRGVGCNTRYPISWCDAFTKMCEEGTKFRKANEKFEFELNSQVEYIGQTLVHMVGKIGIVKDRYKCTDTELGHTILDDMYIVEFALDKTHTHTCHCYATSLQSHER